MVKALVVVYAEDWSIEEGHIPVLDKKMSRGNGSKDQEDNEGHKNPILPVVPVVTGTHCILIKSSKALVNSKLPLF